MTNQRAFPRFPLFLDISVSADGGVQVCRVRDYCAGGMFLMYGKHHKTISEGRQVGLQFVDPGNPAEKHQLVGKVVRAMENGVGVSFTQPNQIAMMVLAQLAERQASEFEEQAKSQITGDIPSIIRSCREMGHEGVLRIVGDFFETANDKLFIAAEESRSNSQQSAFLGALNELQKGKDKLRESILADIEKNFKVLDEAGYEAPSVTPESKAKDDDGLSLVDSQEFDNWLVIRSIVSKIEENIGEDLEVLEARLALIAANPVHKESNPFGPLAVASVFSQTLETLILEDEAKKAIFLVMEGVLEDELRRLCDDLNAMLISHGILPDIKKKMEVVKAPGEDHYAGDEGYSDEPFEEPDEGGAPVTPSSSGGGSGAPRQAPQGQAPQRQAPQGQAPQGQAPQAQAPQGQAPQGQAPQGQAPQGQAPQGQAPQGQVPQGQAPQGQAPQGQAPQSQAPQGQAAPRISYTRPASAGAAPSNEPTMPYENMQGLMHLQGSGADMAPPAPNGYFSSGEVMQALNHLEGAVAAAERAELDAAGHAQYLADTLSQITGEDGKGLSDEDRDTITYVGGLFSSIHQDRHLPQVAKPWLERMEVPLLKAGVVDPSMMEDADHPARQVVNRLEQVGRHVESDASDEKAEVTSQVDELLEQIRKRVDEDPEVFAEVVSKLDGIREGYSANYRQKVDTIVQQCEQEYQLNRVRDTILSALNDILGKRDVPVIILTLLESGFKNLLFRTYVKQGGESETYRSYLSYIDLLTARLARREPVKAKKLASDEVLLQWLPKMLDSASKDKEKNAALVAEVKSYLSGERQPGMKFVPGLMVKSTHLDELHSKPEDLAHDEWQLVLEDVRAFDDGETFVYTDEEKGEEQEVNLVWHAEDDKPPRYVFAKPTGEKMLDLSLGEVANHLYHNVLARMEVRELSVTERATYDFLQNIHNNLSHQAQHDELTGLMNRKSFEQALEDAYTQALVTEKTGVLGYFDLDRFNVINTTCGHKSGDELLKILADIFKVNAGSNATVARLGGDEFGVILEGAGRVDGLKRINALHDEIRDVRFSCEDNEFNVTCSVGLAEINDNIDSSGRLLSAVDAACFTAKDQGRDNIQIHNPENTRISDRTNILEWVGRINVLFDKNLIQLRCQKIDPVQKTVNSLPHYEVLLDVQDEEGNRVPLEEFIVAAERYNRIVDIDTWVVDYVLNWLEEHRSKLSRINGLSINLSGSSIGNRKFMEHIEERLKQEDFPSEKVIFEVTETIAINNLDNAARFMRKIKETGCQFSLDDFGSGTSSYSYLKTLPIDYLKIDGAFVKDIAKNTNDYAVVKSINEIGHVMGKKTVAEYVEDEFCFQALKSIGLDYVQGFGIEKPIPLYKLFG